jgi:hypothetical protein
MVLVELPYQGSFKTSETPLLEPPILQTGQLTIRSIMFNSIVFSVNEM